MQFIIMVIIILIVVCVVSYIVPNLDKSSVDDEEFYE